MAIIIHPFLCICLLKQDLATSLETRWSMSLSFYSEVVLWLFCGHYIVAEVMVCEFQTCFDVAISLWQRPVNEPRLACYVMRSTSPPHPTVNQPTTSIGGRSVDPCLSPDPWHRNKPRSDQTSLGQFSRTLQLTGLWTIIKTYCLKSLDLEVVCYVAKRPLFQPTCTVLLYLVLLLWHSYPMLWPSCEPIIYQFP